MLIVSRLSLYTDENLKRREKMIPTFTSNDLVCKDIENWLMDYIEVNHKFYNYQFPPCPYAKSARVNGLVSIKAYEGKGFRRFVNSCIEQLLADSKKTVCIMVFPSYFKWNFAIKWFVSALNKVLVAKDYYVQFGTALKTKSRYPFSGNKPYFILIVNRLSDVIDGHRALLNTDYYKPWAKHHYDAVVVRREEIYNTYKNH